MACMCARSETQNKMCDVSWHGASTNTAESKPAEKVVKHLRGALVSHRPGMLPHAPRSTRSSGAWRHEHTPCRCDVRCDGRPINAWLPLFSLPRHCADEGGGSWGHPAGVCVCAWTRPSSSSPFGGGLPQGMRALGFASSTGGCSWSSPRLGKRGAVAPFCGGVLPCPLPAPRRCPSESGCASGIGSRSTDMALPAWEYFLRFVAVCVDVRCGVGARARPQGLSTPGSRGGPLPPRGTHALQCFRSRPRGLRAHSTCA